MVDEELDDELELEEELDDELELEDELDDARPGVEERAAVPTFNLRAVPLLPLLRSLPILSTQRFAVCSQFQLAGGSNIASQTAALVLSGTLPHVFVPSMP